MVVSIACNHKKSLSSCKSALLRASTWQIYHGNTLVLNIPRYPMPKLHVTVTPNLHKRLKQLAGSINYSLQEFTEKALTQVCEGENIFSFWTKPEILNPDFTFIDLFAGIGGTRIAFEQNGGKCIFTSEWDRWSQKTYRENFGDNPAGDITKIDPISIPDHDMLVAGFPCQPFSIAGVSKKISLGRDHGFKDKAQGTLFFNVADIIEKKRPPMFLLENVKNLLSHDRGNTFHVIEGALKELNYNIFYKVIDAKGYVPQHRERIFIVGFDKKVFGGSIDFVFPEALKAKKRMASILEKKVDPKYTLSNKLWQYLQDYAKKHKEKGNGFGFGLVDGNSVARTLSARYYKDGSEILVDQGKSKNPRRLTPKECARLMGFPDDFYIKVSDTQAYKQFGNSVVVPVVNAIAANMKQVFLSNYKARA